MRSRRGRPWVITTTAETAVGGVALVAGIAGAAGAVVRALSPDDHDDAVAAVSHVPQVAASLVAARLSELSEDAVGLSGQGVRDVTRIAASDPLLWTQILAGNAPAGRWRGACGRAGLGARPRREARAGRGDRRGQYRPRANSG